MASSTGELIGIILPLGLDTLGVSLALGLAGFTRGVGFASRGSSRRSRRRCRWSVSPSERRLDVYMLAAGDDETRDSDRLLSMTQRGAFGVLALGVSISLDELAIGFSAGLLRLPILAMVIAIGLQAFVVTQIGVRLGGRVGTRAREAAQKVAGVALLGLGAWLLIERLAA